MEDLIMARIKINDLPKDSKITIEEMKRIKGRGIKLSNDLISVESLRYITDINNPYIGLVKPVPAIY